MANLIRSAKSGSDWTANDLAAYNIPVVSQDSATFFGAAVLPDPRVPPEMLQRLEAEDAEDLDTCRTIAAMDLAMNRVPAEESAVDDFAVRLFDMLGYTTRNIAVRTRKDIPLFMCGEYCHAKTDVCLMMNRSEIILLVQKDKSHREEAGDPQPQLIAEAVAAFQINNKKRELAGLPTRNMCLIPGIVMIGTAPTFYKLPVTEELANAVALGTFPTHPTVVHRHIPAVPRPLRRLSEGMKPLDSRTVVLRCFEAFRKFILSE